MLPTYQRRSPVKQFCFALAAVLACSMIPPAFAENVADSAPPTCEGNEIMTATETRYVSTTTTLYQLQTSTAAETLSSGPTETETTQPASTTREVITVTTVPPAVESTVYVNCTSATSTGTSVSTSTTVVPPSPSPTGCVYPPTNSACVPLIAPKKLDIYAALLDGCSIVPARNTSVKWAGVARAHFNRTNGVIRLAIEYSPTLVNVTGVTISRAPLPGMKPKYLRLKISTPRWKPLIFPTSATISTSPVRLTPSAAEALYNGLLYVTVNTARRPVGAIRGPLYCAGPKCAPDSTGSPPTTSYPKFIPKSCNPKNPYAKMLSRQKCFACI